MARFTLCRSFMVSAVVFVALMSVNALASPPTTVSYQGLLTGPGGTPVADGTYPVRFSIWTDSTGGSELSNETQSVSTTDGLFTTELGKTSGFFDVCPPCDGWLQTQVTIGGGIETLTPRTHMVAVPHALTASGLYGEASSGSQMAKGVVKGIGSGSNPTFILLLESDADGDGHPEFLVSDTASTDGARRVVVADVDGDGLADRRISEDCDDTDARLVVANIGSSGQDGVSIDCNASSRRVRLGNLGSSGQDGVDMEVDASLRRLTVGNIGSSGQDGVSINVDGTSRRLTVGNIGSSGQDGVDVDVSSSLRRLTVGNIGSSGQDGVSINVDGTSRRLTVGNIGSSGQDGVDVDVSSSLRRLTVGNIGSSGQDGVSIEVDATSRRLTVGNIGSSGQDGVSIDARASSSKLIVHNIGSSGQDGVHMEAGPDWASFKVGETGIADQATFCVEKDASFGVRVGIDTIPSGHKLSIGGGGAYCDGTDWVNGSDVNTKENFEEVSGDEILDKIEALPISRWNFRKDGETVKHIGPTAQDFKATFDVGANDKAISTIDPSGVALAAIKQLIKENEELRARIAKLEENQTKAQAR